MQRIWEIYSSHALYLKSIVLRDPLISEQFLQVQLCPAYEIAQFSPHILSQVLTNTVFSLEIHM